MGKEDKEEVSTREWVGDGTGLMHQMKNHGTSMSSSH
jgi:hypothetical protein